MRSSAVLAGAALAAALAFAARADEGFPGGAEAGGAGGSPAIEIPAATDDESFAGLPRDAEGAGARDADAARGGGEVPEVSTWAMLGVGFAALAYGGFRRARRDRRYAL